MPDTSSEKPINPWLKSGLELGPPILFFIAYMRFQDASITIGDTQYDGFIIVTAAFVPILLASIAILWKLTGKISRIQVFTAVMVVVFGGLTVWLNDERFFKMKTTLVYGFFATMLGIGLLRGQSWLQFLMGDLLPMRQEGWMIMTKRIAGRLRLHGGPERGRLAHPVDRVLGDIRDLRPARLPLRRCS
jgi:intracellular septation protein